jgi:hypothetical protein
VENLNEIYILRKSSENFNDRIEEIVAASFNIHILEELMVKLENKTPDIPEFMWKKYRRYALKKFPDLDENLYGIADYTYEHSRCKYTLEQLREAEDYYENEYFKDIYVIEKIPFYE